MDKVLSEVAAAITPNNKERENLGKFAKRVVKLINSYGYESSVEGSFAKDTWITGNHDIDVFMFFEKGTPKEVLGNEGIDIGKKVIKNLGGEPELAFSEHPYVRTKINNIDLDIVPCYRMSSIQDMGSAVDRTPFHTEYINRNLSEKQKKDVRLLKQFTKGVGVYSAKEKVRGFSGYLCELLIIRYGTFKNLIRTAAKEWEHGLVIDIEEYHPNKKKLWNRFKTAMVVIDPTDPNRNVAAALDSENFELFIQACENFTKRPALQFFFPNLIKPYTKEQAGRQIEKHGRIFVVKFKTPKLQEDTLYSQIRRARKMIARNLGFFEFKVRESDMFSNDDTFLLFEVESSELPKTRIVQGPPTTVPQKFQDTFVKKYKKQKPRLEGGRWCVEVPRKYTKAEQIITDMLAHPEKIGIPKYIADSMKKSHKILSGKAILSNYDGEFARFLTRFLSKKQPWEW